LPPADGAAADVAATLIANAVQLPRVCSQENLVQQVSANTLAPDTDLGARKVTVAVAALPEEYKHAAAQQGLQAAHRLRQRTPLFAVFIDCQGYRVSTGDNL